MTESQVWTKLAGGISQACRARGAAFFMHRVECQVTPGMPDVRGTIDGVSFWIELKIRRGNRVKFQPLQPLWIESEVDAGGRVFVLVASDQGYALYNGSRVSDMDGCPLPRPDYTFHGPTDWARFVDVLVGDVSCV